MSKADGRRTMDFVPASFEDLRRNTRAESQAMDQARDEKLRGQEDFQDFVSDGGFMRQSKRLAMAAFAIGGLLLLAGYAKPLWQTATAFQTAGAAAKSAAEQQVEHASRIAGGAQAIKATDDKAIGLAKGGLSCLTGKSGCPAGVVSPFK